MCSLKIVKETKIYEIEHRIGGFFNTLILGKNVLWAQWRKFKENRSM